MYKVVRLFTEV